MSAATMNAERLVQTIFELAEDGAGATRSKIARRIDRGITTVSGSIDRLEREGLVRATDNRQITLTRSGADLAVTVVRKHRLVEIFLAEIVGLDWELLHAEATRWQHVVSETFERKLVELLKDPGTSPYGCAVPGLDSLHGSRRHRSARVPAQAGRGRNRPTTLLDVAVRGGGIVRIGRIPEHVQSMPGALAAMTAAGMLPGNKLRVSASPPAERVSVNFAGRSTVLDAAAGSVTVVREAV